MNFQISRKTTGLAMKSPAIRATFILVKKASPTPVPMSIALPSRPAERKASCSGHVRSWKRRSAAKKAMMKPTKIAITQRIRRERNSRKWSSNGIAAAGLGFKDEPERLGSLLAKSVDRAYFCGSVAVGGGGVTTSGGVRGVRAG